MRGGEETVAAVSKHPTHSRARLFIAFLGEEQEMRGPFVTLPHWGGVLGIHRGHDRSTRGTLGGGPHQEKPELGKEPAQLSVCNPNTWKMTHHLCLKLFHTLRIIRISP